MKNTKEIEYVSAITCGDGIKRFFCFADDDLLKDINIDMRREVDGKLIRIFHHHKALIPDWMEPKEFKQYPEKWTIAWNKSKMLKLTPDLQRYLIKFPVKDVVGLAEYMSRDPKKITSTHTKDIQMLVKLHMVSNNPGFPLDEKLRYRVHQDLSYSGKTFSLDSPSSFGISTSTQKKKKK